MTTNNTTIKCPHCDAIVNTETALRNCSNCFACSGCERYICPVCQQEIVIQEVKKPSLRKK